MREQKFWDLRTFVQGVKEGMRNVIPVIRLVGNVTPQQMLQIQ